MEYRIENCAGSAESARRAQLGGAYRIELCAGLPEGGTTPSYGEIVAARRAVDIKLNVIIRPRAGDFLYTPIEVEAMLEDIKMARQLGVDGIVVGCLTPDGEVDKPLLRRFVEASGDLPVTFHRAIDVCRDPSAALEDIIKAGCARVLTSGGKATALEGAEVIAQLVKQAGDRIIIMPGAGVTPENIAELARITGAKEFHFTGRVPEPSPMRYRHEGVSMGGTVTIDEYAYLFTDPIKISGALEALASLDEH
ncbi:copper homeostasis protein CutC [uncultured Porphyromonas sp.]|uniref:copper homeostasis protein CutC n=1 Tax=uncultured Porphyromonas sp. TaxID=159274 RepID=UPI00260949C5|nr:copper homeostasis protein CutC [uncultured Porphyromonas sp.]